jgi:beta-N-acetylhexosaminidase
MTRRALIIGLSGEQLCADERAFLAEARPAGVILFARNCATPAQLRRLVDDTHAAIDLAPGQTLVLIDQEGGRVRRLRPPHWRELPAAAAYAAIHAIDPARCIRLAWLVARLTAHDLRDVGVNMNCAPVLDLRFEGAHGIIGDRAYGREPHAVAAIAGAVAEGYMAGGVVPVIKHIPGHGRALADSHLELPVVATSRAELEATDFASFRALAHLPAAMTAHVVYSAIDAQAPASTSPIVTADVIRGHIGFDGLLMSDDLGMKALTGDFRARAEAVIAAGSDLVLHCSSNLEEAQAVAAGTPLLAGAARARFERALAVIPTKLPYDRSEAEDALRQVLEKIA